MRQVFPQGSGWNAEKDGVNCKRMLCVSCWIAGRAAFPVRRRLVDADVVEKSTELI
jgi:hypothetical protein